MLDVLGGLDPPCACCISASEHGCVYSPPVGADFWWIERYRRPWIRSPQCARSVLASGLALRRFLPWRMGPPFITIRIPPPYRANGSGRLDDVAPVRLLRDRPGLYYEGFPDPEGTSDLRRVVIRSSIT